MVSSNNQAQAKGGNSPSTAMPTQSSTPMSETSTSIQPSQVPSRPQTPVPQQTAPPPSTHQPPSNNNTNQTPAQQSQTTPPPTTAANTNALSEKPDEHAESPNTHTVHPDIKIHAVITADLDHDHTQALRIPLGQVTDEQLVAELAERDLAYDCRISCDYDMTEHHKATKIPLEAVTDDELLAEVQRRKLTLYEDMVRL